MKHHIEIEKLRLMVEAVIFNTNLREEAAKDLVAFLPYMDESSIADLYLICCELEAKYITELGTLESAHLKASGQERSRLKDKIDSMRVQLELAQQLSELTQPESDHNLRGVIHYLKKVVAGS